MENIIYAASDIFPSPKGSTSRIAATLSLIKELGDKVFFFCQGDRSMPLVQKEENIVIRRFRPDDTNFLKRSLSYSNFIEQNLHLMKEPPQVVHFRDPWSALPLLKHNICSSSKKIYEINGLPSIELPVHYPHLVFYSKMIKKLKQLELDCMKKADKIITVSNTNKSYITSLGICEEKIAIIPNSGEMPLNSEDNQCNDQIDISGNYIIYAGTLAPWQGISTLFQSFSLIKNECDLTLVIASSTTKYLSKIKKEARKLGILERIKIETGVSRKRLSILYKNGLFSLCPLTRGDRNELQGCCPVKILESMWTGTPVIASRLPVTSEIMQHGKDGWLVEPESPRALASAILKLWQDEELLKSLGENAVIKVKRSFSKDLFHQRLRRVYDELGANN